LEGIQFEVRILFQRGWHFHRENFQVLGSDIICHQLKDPDMLQGGHESISSQQRIPLMNISREEELFSGYWSIPKTNYLIAVFE